MIPKHQYILNLVLSSKVAQVEGEIVECGTWKGGMIAGIASVLGPDRRYHLFDSYEGLPPAKDKDGIKAKEWQRDTAAASYYDNCTASEIDARRAMEISSVQNYSVHKGWFEKTVADWAEERPKIALLRLDSDWYDSTIICLRALAPLVVQSGIIIIDDYYYWEGCAKAVHDYIATNEGWLLRQYLNGPVFMSRAET